MVVAGSLESWRDESNSSLPDFHWILNEVVDAASDEDQRTSSFWLSMLYTATAVGASGTCVCADALGVMAERAAINAPTLRRRGLPATFFDRAISGTASLHCEG